MAHDDCNVDLLLSKEGINDMHHHVEHAVVVHRQKEVMQED